MANRLSVVNGKLPLVRRRIGVKQDHAIIMVECRPVMNASNDDWPTHNAHWMIEHANAPVR